MSAAAATTPAEDFLAGASHLISPAHLGAHFSKGAYWLAPHIELLSEYLVKVASGDINRLMVLMPPRHGKTETASHWFPTWYLSLFPGKRVILGSATADYAREHGVFVRNALIEHWPELRVSLVKDTKAGNHWRTADGGGMRTVGVRSQVTGRGGDVLMLDDTVKDAVDAGSETVQKRNVEWWKSTFRTRLQPGGSIVVIGTPWDEGDIIGWLRAAHAKGPGTEGYEPWQILRLPARAEGEDELGRAPGEPLWPELWGSDVLRDLEASVGPHWWTSLFQLRPTAIGGDLFKEADWSYWVPRGMLHGDDRLPDVVIGGRTARMIELPDLDAEIQSWDMNHRDDVQDIEDGKEPDAVAGHVWGRSGAWLFLLDRFHGTPGLLGTIAAVRKVSKDNPKAKTKVVEYTANGPAVMRRLERELGSFVPATPLGSKTNRAMGLGITDKDRGARAISFQASQAAGDVFLPHPDIAPWVPAFRAALGKFPKAGRDDTDAASQAWSHLQGPAWQQLDKAQREAGEKGPPPKTPAEVLRNALRQQIAKERTDATKRPHANRYRRFR